MTSSPPEDVGGNEIYGDRPWRQFYGFTANEIIVLTALHVTTAVPGSIANGLMISSILLTRKLRENVTCILLLNLAIGDFLVCVVYQPLLVLLMNDYVSGVMNTVVYWLGFSLQVTSLNGMLCLTVDRFVSICYPLRYVIWITEKRAHTMIAATWLVSLAFTLAKFSPDVKANSFIYIVVAFFLMLGLQIAIFVTARRQTRQISSQFAALGINLPYKHRPTKGITSVMGAFLLCWLPIMVTPSTQSHKAIIISVWFVSLNSLVNPIICCWQITDVKKALCKLLGFRPRQDVELQPRARPTRTRLQEASCSVDRSPAFLDTNRPVLEPSHQVSTCVTMITDCPAIQSSLAEIDFKTFSPKKKEEQQQQVNLVHNTSLHSAVLNKEMGKKS